MIKLFVIILIAVSFQVEAVSLSQKRSSSEGSSFVSYKFEKGKISLDKRSNYFDKKKSLKIGTFSSTSPSILIWEKELEKVLKTVKASDDFLRTKGSDFNSLAGKLYHQSYLLIDDFIISKDSNQFQTLNDILSKLQALEWTQNSGISLSEDFKKLDVIKNGKVQSSEAFDLGFRCKDPKTPTVCGYKDLGILYVE